MDWFERSVMLPVSVDEAWAWHRRPGAFERLVPPWEDIEVLDRAGSFDTGSVTLRMPVGPLSTLWVSQHRPGRDEHEWIDGQVRGPFAHWDHSHRFEPVDPGRCRLTDRITYQLPMGVVGQLAGPWVRRRMERAFTYRHAVTVADLAQHAAWAGRPRQTVAMTGASGLIGRSLATLLTTGGHRVLRLVRRPPRHPEEVRWDPVGGVIDRERLEGVDAVVHMAGKSIAAIWTGENRNRIRRSRVDPTTLLATTLAGLSRPPRTLVMASAVGIYGDRGSDILTERSATAASDGQRPFLVDVAHAWEAAAEPAEHAGIRVVKARIGPVLTPAGGMLATILPIFGLGLGGRIGPGTQYLSWITLDDVLGGLYHSLMQDALSGPVNLVAPEPVTNSEFTSTLGSVLRRPCLAPVPAWAVKALPGGMGEELLLFSVRLVPERLQATGYQFRLPRLRDALHHVLGRS